MTFLVTAWKVNHPGLTHRQNLCTLAGVQRLMTALVEQTDADYITIHIIPPPDDSQIPLPTPSSSPTGHKSALTPENAD